MRRKVNGKKKSKKKAPSHKKKNVRKEAKNKMEEYNVW